MEVTKLIQLKLFETLCPKEFESYQKRVKREWEIYARYEKELWKDSRSSES
jgi:hypothetical protein